VDAASLPDETDESATRAVEEIDSAALEPEQADGEADAELQRPPRTGCPPQKAAR